MAYRRFTDATGETWEVRDDSASEWRFEPVSGNPAPARSGRVPHYESDPFELTELDLRKLLDAAQPARSKPAKNPFLD